MNELVFQGKTRQTMKFIKQILFSCKIKKLQGDIK